MFTFNIEFLPIIFLVVYVGAVSVLFLFVVMMLNIKIIETSENFFNYLPIGIIVGFIFFIELYLLVFKNYNIYFFNVKENLPLYNYLNDLLISDNKDFLKIQFVYNDDFFVVVVCDLNGYNFVNNKIFDYLISFFNIEFISYIYIKDFLIDIEIIAQVIYKHNFFAFIISSLILLIAMIGAIVLTLTVKRNNFNTKRQDISEQVYRKIKLKIYKNFNFINK